ncbi:unnamed protein product [Strongylus vulgaris]|uniref:BRCT domain-containing protein n=1 Tax=Strongylus vulgaris TaxID=40348 RepID=A0A3P7IHI9_STRVU|nr:unnamed protein product [Strongylus vulgaris]
MVVTFADAQNTFVDRLPQPIAGDFSHANSGNAGRNSFPCDVLPENPYVKSDEEALESAGKESSLVQKRGSPKELRDIMEQSMDRLGKEDNASNFGYYMQLKKDKLRYQVNVLDRPSVRSSEIFKGISIFVNGYTEPTALELRQLIQLHGGEYHCYYEYGVTSYVIAASLAAAKVGLDYSLLSLFGDFVLTLTGIVAKL